MFVVKPDDADCSNSIPLNNINIDGELYQRVFRNKVKYTFLQ